MSNDDEKKQQQQATDSDASDSGETSLEQQQQQQALLMKVSELLTRQETAQQTQQRQAADAELMSLVKQHDMTLLYRQLCSSEAEHLRGWVLDEAVAREMATRNEKELAELDAKVEDAKENHGDIEVKNATLARADFFARIGDKERAIKAYEETLEITVGGGGRIDVVFALIRLGLAQFDMDLVRANVERAKQFVAKGGDWERRNLLKVYEASYLMLIRDFEAAAKLLLDCVATFTCYELFDYNRFAFYTVLLGVLTLDRPTVRDKIVLSPDILAVIREVPHLHPLLTSLHDCKYQQFLQSLADISEDIKTDRFLSTHFGFYVREVRIVAYRQFLQSYLSVTLQSMADQFGVPTDFLDAELSRFIAAGRLNCKIDKVNGVVQTVRADRRNSQYQDVIKSGDHLLSRIQKLTKTVAL
eukprot:TRINITY_DN66190_c6_g1_i1.p1 TRINITY_DN66190_c6_g1~~TRINITY_DN66190_c6_g1_i1.p1  ORF type:complete len:416 (-),score=240.44 TRINITY_DN66190_c6_g1_i1:267-1514(-)